MVALERLDGLRTSFCSDFTSSSRWNYWWWTLAWTTELWHCHTNDTTEDKSDYGWGLETLCQICFRRGDVLAGSCRRRPFLTE